MKIKSSTLHAFPLVFGIAAIAVAPLHAQNNGFRIGQQQPAPPQNSQTTSGPLLIAPMASPIQPTANPIAPIGGPVGPPQNTAQKTPRPQDNFMVQGMGAVTILPAGGTIFVPAGTMVIESGFGMEAGAFLSAPPSPASPAAPATPSGARAGGTSIDRTTRPTTVNQPVTPADVTRLALGTTREKVIEKYGNPIAFIMNMNGETLYFRDGVVVFIKDGVVAVPGTLPTTTRP